MYKFLISIVILGGACQDNSNANESTMNPVSLVKPKDSKVDSAIQRVYNEHDSFLPKKSVILINLREQEGSVIELRTGTLGVSNIQDYFRDVSVPLFGYYTFQKANVFVFGEKASQFFEKSSRDTSFEYLNIQSEKSIPDRQISYPPKVIHDVANVYEYKSNKFVFIKSGWGILERNSNDK